MSKNFRMTAIAALAALASSASMAETMNMDVKALVTGTCKLVAANALDFGSLDSTNAIAVTGKTTTITYLCSKGKAPAVLKIGGADSSTGYKGTMLHTTSTDPLDKISYDLSWGASPAGKGMGSGMEVALTVTGAIAAGAYSSVSVGDYKEVVIVDLTP